MGSNLYATGSSYEEEEQKPMSAHLELHATVREANRYLASQRLTSCHTLLS